MNEADRNTLNALRVRAAALEARRQDALQAGDRVKAEGLERELQRLWHQHQEIEARIA